MKKLLIITYYWPPSGGAAVQRWLSFANKLAERGIAVHVLTVGEQWATFQLRDESLVKEIHPAIKVYTTKTSEPFGIFTFLFGKKSMPKPAFANESNNPSLAKKISRFIRGNFFIPDPRKGWVPYAVKEAKSVIDKEEIQCVITAGPPHSTHFIGETLKKEKGIYWIADFHDLWTDVIYYDMLYHLPVVKKIDSKLERRVLEGADLVVTVGDKYKEKLLSKSGKLQPGKIDILRIGFDEKLFPAGMAKTEQEQFVITYTGTIADYYQPGVFVEALKKVVKQQPDVSIRFRFAGVLAGPVRQMILDAGLESILEERGYVSHREAIQLLLSSTVLLLVNPVTKDEEMVIPGKLYEYLAAGKPIINIVKQGAETAEIITACQAGKSFDRTQQTELEAYLLELITAWQQRKNVDLTNNGEVVRQYARGEIANHLQQIIERNT